jgi:uncharacterized Zn-binding protein involved in type VI secretion
MIHPGEVVHAVVDGEVRHLAIAGDGDTATCLETGHVGKASRGGGRSESVADCLEQIATAMSPESEAKVIAAIRAGQVCSCEVDFDISKGLPILVVLSSSSEMAASCNQQQIDRILKEWGLFLDHINPRGANSPLTP